MNRSHLVIVLVSLAGAGAAPTGARADPVQGASDPCRTRHPGDPCEADDFEGICRRRRCTRETDDGVRSFHCLVCESRHHGHRSHHRRRGDASVGAASDVALTSDATLDAAHDAAEGLAVVVVDAPTPTRVSAPPARPRRGVFSCAAGVGAPGAGWVAWLLLATCAARRRVSPAEA